MKEEDEDERGSKLAGQVGGQIESKTHSCLSAAAPTEPTCWLSSCQQLFPLPATLFSTSQPSTRGGSGLIQCKDSGGS